MQNLVDLMLYCYSFITYRFTVFGHSFSIFEVTLCCWCFDMAMDFVFKMFGGKEVD